jgi:hypothetical protein
MKTTFIAFTAALLLASCGGGLDEGQSTMQASPPSSKQADIDPGGGGGCGTTCFHHTQWDSCLRWICSASFCWFYTGPGLTSWDDCYNSCTGTWSYMLNFSYCR